MFDYHDQVVIVTGAAGNLGRAVAQGLAEAGASLALVDHRSGRLEEALPALAHSGAHELIAPVDLGESAQVQRMVERVIARYGRIDALVNAAGGYGGGTPVHETTLEEWDRLYTLNLRTALHTCRAVLPHMLERRSGRIVNISSKQALQGGSNVAAYSAAKAAVIRLTESLAAEVKAQGITVNCVLPSTIDSPENRASMPKADPSKWVTADSLSGVILFLASSLARDITGASIPVFGRM